MNRAYSVLEIKSIDEDQRIIEGVATTPSTDRVGDIVEPLGGEIRTTDDGAPDVPIKWQHGKDPRVGDVGVGYMLSAKATKAGIPVRVQFAKTSVPGMLKETLDFVWQSVKMGLVKGFSIGFNPLEEEPIKGTYGIRYTRWEMLELSVVTVPANADATIQTIKSYDLGAPAADSTAPRSKSPGASGRPVKIDTSPPKKKGQMTITEQIREFEATRQAKAARMDELMKQAGEKRETLDESQEEEFDTLEAELAKVDKHLVRLRSQEQINKAAAVPVAGTSTSSAAETRTTVISVQPRVEKGIGFARYTMAMLNCKGNSYEAAEYARQRWPEQPEVQALCKAAVAAGTTTDATWAGPLAVVSPLAGEFLELLRPKTLLGKIPGLRKVPFNTSVPAQTGGGTYSWVGQGAAKPVSALAFSTVTLPFAKAAGIVVLTKELVKLSTPSAQELVRDDMINGMQTFLDTQFIDPAVAISANVSPASITNGVTGTAAGGTTEAFARSDLRALMNTFNTNNLGLDGVVLIMSESVAFTLGTMVNAVGGQAFPGITAQGGTLLGIPVVTSNVVGAQIVAVHAPSVLYADDGQVEIDVSEQASLQMDGAPMNPADATVVMVSLWQRNLVGLRADRFVTWLKARANVVQRIHTVAYV